MTQSTIKIIFKNFTGSFEHLEGSDSLQVSRRALAREMMTIGYRDQFAALEATNAWYLKYKEAMCMANTKVDEKGYLGPSECFKKLPPSGRANVAEELGVALTSLCADLLLKVPWVVDLNSIEKDKDDPDRIEWQGTADLEPKIIIGKSKGTAREPDLIGFDHNEDPHVLESKGYSSGYRSAVHQHAIDQVSRVGRIDGRKPATKVACFHNLSKAPFVSHLCDPEGDGEGLQLPLSFHEFIRAYYRPFIEDEIWRSAPRQEWNDRVFRLWLLPGEIYFGLDDEILSSLLDKEIPKSAFDWYARLRSREDSERIRTWPGGSVGTDGVMLLIGSGDQSDWTASLTYPTGPQSDLLADISQLKVSAFGPEPVGVGAELARHPTEIEIAKLNGEGDRGFSQIVSDLVSKFPPIEPMTEHAASVEAIARRLAGRLKKAFLDDKFEVLSITLHGSALGGGLVPYRDVDLLIETTGSQCRHVVFESTDLSLYPTASLNQQGEVSSPFLMSLKYYSAQPISLSPDSELAKILKSIEPRKSYQEEKTVASLSGWLLFAPDAYYCDPDLTLRTLVWCVRTIAIAVVLERDVGICSLGPASLEANLKNDSYVTLLNLKNLTSRVSPYHLQMFGRFLMKFGEPQPQKWQQKTLHELVIQLHEDDISSLEKTGNHVAADLLSRVHARAESLHQSCCRLSSR